MVLLTAEQQRAFDATLRKRSQLEAARRDGSGSKRDAFEQKWTDGHGVQHSRASGRGKKGDETMRVLSVIDESPVFALDEGDPNYDSTEEPISFRSVDGDGKSDVIVEYKKKAETIIDEYFTSADIDEAWLSVERLDAPAYEHFFVKRLITLAMDRGHREKEAAVGLETLKRMGKLNPSGYLTLGDLYHNLGLLNPSLVNYELALGKKEKLKKYQLLKIFLITTA